MPPPPSSIRVVVRLPYNRPEEALLDPPRVEWNTEKEQILWEVIAKSRAVEGAGTDWKGLAAHLQVPLPYLLFRAQTRYEEDLRGLQGIRGALSPTIISPTSQIPLSPLHGGFNAAAGGPSKPNSATAEYFPKLPTPVSAGSRKDFPRLGISNGTMSSSTTARPLNVRARLSSLSQSSRTRRMSTMSQQSKGLGSSVVTLQGPKRSREHIRLGRLSPTASSRASPSAVSSNDASSEDENDKAEEEERRAEQQQALDLKLKNLQKIMTREALGFVASPISPSRSQIQSINNIKGKEVDRGRTRPLSASSASMNLPPRLNMSRRNSTSQTPSHHSLSSASSPQGSIPSIPSPPPERRSQPQSPMARRLNEQFKSTSPPTVSTRPAWAQTTRHGTVSRTKIGGGRSERGSEMGSEASSFSDLSDASLSASALESALMSNMRGGSRYSSVTPSSLPGRRGSVR